ncbi:unnamed protein product, partial [Prorocentrum cordatum]
MWKQRLARSLSASPRPPNVCSVELWSPADLGDVRAPGQRVAEASAFGGLPSACRHRGGEVPRGRACGDLAEGPRGRPKPAPALEPISPGWGVVCIPTR